MLVNHYSGSPRLGMEFRHYYLADELRRAGHEACVVASRWSHLRREQPAAVGRGVRLEDHEGIPHAWLAGGPYRSNGARRLLNMGAFAHDLWRSADTLAAAFRPDVVLASSPHPFVAYGAHRVARRARARFVFEIRDLWPLSLIELLGVSPRHPLVRLLDRAEQYGCDHADLVVSLLSNAGAYLADRRVDPARIVVIGNGVRLDEWSGDPPPLRDDVARFVASARAAGHALVGYAGTHGGANCLDELLGAAALLRDRPVSFVLVGSGEHKEALARSVRAQGLAPRVGMFDPVPKAQIPSLLAGVDVGYLGTAPIPLYRFGIALNKLMDYMMAGVPVLHSLESQANPAEVARCGLRFVPGDARSLADAIVRLLGLPDAERRAMTERGRAHVRANHAYPELAARLLDAVGRC